MSWCWRDRDRQQKAPQKPVRQPLCDYGGLQLFPKHVDLLNHNLQLDDKIMGVAFQWLADEVYKDREDEVVFVNPQNTHHFKGDLELCKQLAEDLYLKHLRLKFFCINDAKGVRGGGAHWSLLVHDADTNTFYHCDSSPGSHRDVARRIAVNISRTLWEPEDGEEVGLFLYTKARYNKQSGSFMLQTPAAIQSDTNAPFLRSYEDLGGLSDMMWDRTLECNLANTTQLLASVCPQIEFVEVDTPRQVDGTSCGMYAIHIAYVLAELLRDKQFNAETIRKLKSRVSAPGIQTSRKHLAAAIEDYAETGKARTDIWPRCETLPQKINQINVCTSEEKGSTFDAWTPGALCDAFDTNYGNYYHASIQGTTSNKNKFRVKFFGYNETYVMHSSDLRPFDSPNVVKTNSSGGPITITDREMEQVDQVRRQYEQTMKRTANASATHQKASKSNASTTPKFCTGCGYKYAAVGTLLCASCKQKERYVTPQPDPDSKAFGTAASSRVGGKTTPRAAGSSRTSGFATSRAGDTTPLTGATIIRSDATATATTSRTVTTPPRTVGHSKQTDGATKRTIDATTRIAGTFATHPDVTKSRRTGGTAASWVGATSTRSIDDAGDGSRPSSNTATTKTDAPTPASPLHQNQDSLYEDQSGGTSKAHRRANNPSGPRGHDGSDVTVKETWREQLRLNSRVVFYDKALNRWRNAIVDSKEAGKLSLRFPHGDGFFQVPVHSNLIAKNKAGTVSQHR